MAKKGEMVIWCQTCEKYYIQLDESVMPVCPRCGTAARTMRCVRCGHVWSLSSSGRLPKTCASKTCKSPYWNRMRMARRSDGTRHDL